MTSQVAICVCESGGEVFTVFKAMSLNSVDHMVRKKLLRTETWPCQRKNQYMKLRRTNQAGRKPGTCVILEVV